MYPYLPYSLFLVPIFITYKIINYIAYNISADRKARQLGCKPAADDGDDGFFGWRIMRRILRADREQRIPEVIQERFDIMTKKEGRFVTTQRFNFLGQVHHNTIDPRNVQAVLATQFKDFALGKTRNDNFSILLGDGIFASDGPTWEHARAMLRPQFNRSQIADLDSTEHHLQNLLSAIIIHADPRDNGEGWTSALDISPFFFRFTLDTSTEFLLGESCNSQLAELGRQTGKPIPTGTVDGVSFAAAFDRGQAKLSFGARLGELYWLTHDKEFRAIAQKSHAFVDYYVNRALSLKAAGKLDEASVAENGHERYVFAHALAKETSNAVGIRNQLINIMVAGRDTTAATLSWLFLLFLQYPRVYHKLRQVIIEDFGPYTAPPKDITLTKLKGCQYLQWTLHEVLRLYPAVPFNSRNSVRDTTLPFGGGHDGQSPVFVRANSEVNYSVHLMHRRKDIWGPDAEEFRPERWDGRKPTHPFDYLPFNAGPRICLGQQFALTVMGFVVVRLLQRFEDLRVVEGVGMPKSWMDVKHQVNLINTPGSGVKMYMKLAKVD